MLEPIQTDHRTEERNVRVIPDFEGIENCQLLMSPQRLPSVCTPRRPGRAFDIAHGYPLPPAFERTLSIPISRHRDILLLIRRHRPSPISSMPLSLSMRPTSPKAEPPFLTTGRLQLALMRPPLGCLIFRLSRFDSPIAQRHITDTHTNEITTKKYLLSQVASTF